MPEFHLETKYIMLNKTKNVLEYKKNSSAALKQMFGTSNHQKYSIANTHTWPVLLKINKQILVRHFIIS